MIRRYAVTALGALAAAGIGTHAHAAGFALGENSAIESGEADSGAAAAADDLSTVTTNPAGMTYFSGVNAMATTHFIDPSGSFSLTGARTNIGPLPIPESGGAGPDPTRTAWVPSAYMVVAPAPDIRLGLGASVPFGLTTNWASDSAARYQAEVSKVESFDLNPSIAYKVAPWLSLGAGFSAQWTKVQLSNAIDFGTLVPLSLEQLGLIGPQQAAALLAAGSGRTINDGHAYVSGSSWEAGYDFGAIVEPMPGMRIGASYRSGIDHAISGLANFTVPQQYARLIAATGQFTNTNANATLNLPDNFMIGISDDVTPDLTLNLNYKWTGWSRFQQIAVGFGNPRQPGVIEPENYQDTSTIAVGGSYKGFDPLTLRAGFAYDESPVQDQFRDLRLPDADRYWLTIGATYKLTPNIALSGSYQHLFFGDAGVNHSTTFVPGVVNTVTGSADTSADLIAAEVSVSF
ncbi:MAG TPA: porin [Stellaceae bacterium]|nr:porin [Stellaceae bacterium]